MIKSSSLINNYSSITLKAPAKINWFLTVLRKRKDGFHDIETLMQCIGLYDIIHFNNSDKIEVVCDLNIPLQDNLVFKAASLLKGYASYKKGVRITLRKNIPISAGLGGGSSDAAYTLSGLNKFWGLGLTKDELMKLGLEIGSDVPFFLESDIFAFVEGRGEKITPLHIRADIIFLIVKPSIAISTHWVYKNIVRLTNRTVDIKLFCQTLNNKDFISLGEMLINDLESVVVKTYPVVKEIKEKLLEKGALISAMSGSGPTVFGVFESVEKASSASMAFRDCWTAVVHSPPKLD
ncbi:MAG: 4-(cytidine 5'-diphospho)-2-C-methyl-D-erythritol kinase [Nitrospirae bacterium]|nr:4-(cytidine 5'-diphospho)-2-C-methyl-D-erythritol kinase [Nitrospirota bacterium]